MGEDGDGGGEDGSGGGSWWRTAMAVAMRTTRASGRIDGGSYTGRLGELKATRWGRMAMAAARMAARIDGGGGGAAAATLARPRTGRPGRIDGVHACGEGRRWRQ